MTEQAAQGPATRDQLIAVATRLFGEQGYEGTTIEDVLGAAGVSRGALHQHFAGKDALLEASFQLVQNRLMAGLLEVIAAAPSSLAALRTAALVWIDLAGDPVVSRIVLLDGPAVLGWERWRIRGDETRGNIRAMLQAVADEGHLAPDLVNSFARILLVSLDEIALMIAQAENPAGAMAEGRTAVEELLRRLIAP